MDNEPVKPDKIRAAVQGYAGKDTPTEYDPRKWGAMIGWLNKYLITDELRRLVLGWLFAFPEEPFEPISSSTLTAQQKNGVAHWVGTWKNEDNQEWMTRDTFPQECINVLNVARYDMHKLSGQLSMDLPFEFEGEIQGVIKEAIEDPLWNPEQHWCDWCGDVLSVQGVPCAQCEALGADEPLPDYVNVEDAPPPPKRRVTGVAV